MVEKARLFLQGLSSADISGIADDLLVFLYDLHDNYRITQSSGSRFSAKSFGFLNDLIYNLESRPDETMQSDHWREFIRAVLDDIVAKRIVIAKK
jgi:ABC-type sugar transport system substrate-binding protein